MPLYPDYLYGGTSSSFSSPYSYASSSSSPPSSPYSRVGTHWPIIGYSPLTALLSANISSLNTTPRRTYTPYLSAISEKSPALGRHLFANRHSPKNKLLYFQSRPVTINTENINLSKDNIKEKKDSVSMSGPIQRGKTVVRMHTKKLKENPGLKKVKKTPGAMLMEKFLIKEPPKEDTYNWREEYNNRKNQVATKKVSPVRYTTEEKEKEEKEEPMVVDEEVSPIKVEETVRRLSNSAPVVAPVVNQQRRMSITDERLQEEAAILDSLIQEEMKEGQKKLEVRRRRKSTDLLEEDSVIGEDVSAKRIGKKKYVRQPSGERSSRTLPLDLLEESATDERANADDLKKSVRKRPTVKRKPNLKIVVNEITVEEKVEPKVPRKLNYEVIVEEGKEDDASDEVVTKVFPRPRPPLAIKRRPTIKRMFSRDKEALAARTESSIQEPKTEKPSDLCSRPSESQEEIPTPVTYRTEFFLKGEHPILEETDTEIKEQITKSSQQKLAAEAGQSGTSSMKVDSRLNVCEPNKICKEQAGSKPLVKPLITKDIQQQKVPSSTNKILSNVPGSPNSKSSDNKFNKDQSNLKPLTKFPFSKDTKQQKVPESVVQDVNLENQLKSPKATEPNKKNLVDSMKNEVKSKKQTEEKTDAPLSTSPVIDEKSVIPTDSTKDEESPVIFRSEFVLWGAPDGTDSSEKDKTAVINGVNSNLVNSVSESSKIDLLKKQELKTETKVMESLKEQQNTSESEQQLNIQKPKPESSSKITSSQVDKKSSGTGPKVETNINDKSKTISDVKVSKGAPLEEKPTATQDKRKQSIFGDVLVKNDKIKLFGVQVKSDVPPKVNEPKISVEKFNDPSKVNGVKNTEKTVMPQFMRKNGTDTNAKKIDGDRKIIKDNNSVPGFLKKKVMDQKPQELNKVSVTQDEKKAPGEDSKSKVDKKVPESLSIDNVEKSSQDKNRQDKTEPKLDNNSIEKSVYSLDGGAAKTSNVEEKVEDKKGGSLSKQEGKKQSSTPSSPTNKTIIDNRNYDEMLKDVPTEEKHTQLVPNKGKLGTPSKSAAQEKSKTTMPEKAAKTVDMKTPLAKTQPGKSEIEKVKPDLKLMNGEGKSKSLDESCIGAVKGEEISNKLLKKVSSKDKITNKEEKNISSSNSMGSSKHQGVSSPATASDEVVKKDSSKKLVGKTKEKSESKMTSPVGTKKGSKETNKKKVSKAVDVPSSVVGSETSEVKVNELEKVKKLEEKTVVDDKSSKNCDKVVEKKIGIAKPSAVSDNKTSGSDCEGVREKSEVEKPSVAVQKKDVGKEIRKEPGVGEKTVKKSSIVSEEKDVEENRMTVRRRMTKHKTNLSETRMSLMMLEQKKRKEAEVRQGDEKQMSKENQLSGEQVTKNIEQSEDVKVELIAVNNKKENEEECAKKEESEEEDTETEEESSEEDESTEVGSSSEYESDGSAESRERSSGSPLRHLSDSSLGLGGLDEVTTAEVSRCRVTPPATTLPRFRKYSIQDFQFLKVLGKGSFGKVLLAELSGTECYYAVKCLKKDVVLEDDDVECTLIERKVLALGTNHPYLCHLFCTFQTESHLFFVMEYLNGGDLMFHIQQSGRFDEGRARFYASEIVSGLMFLHKKGIVYRDLKLDNILLDFDGHVRIADFGMCKLQIYLDRTADTFCGTPDYMAPEIIKGLAYNQCVDWWSFGILLYEMLVGQSPFSGCDEDDLFWSICNEQPHYPRFLSKESKLILSQLLEKDSSRRLGSSELSGREVTSHVFFRDWDWLRLERRQLDPPFKPRRHPLDVQYFDKAFTNERPRLTPIDKSILQSMDQTQFQGFSYTNPNVTK